jgi:putrescine transport system ATP-binding protein
MASSPARADSKTPIWNDPQAAPYINIESVTKKFGEFVAVNDVSLKVYRGELFCLLGGVRRADQRAHFHRRRRHDRHPAV